MDDKSFNIRIPKKWARTGLVVLVTAILVAPLTALAAHQFTDVPDSNIFHNDISWMSDAGVTLGCNSAHTKFCPKDVVTRETMAAFMHRLAINQVVDADKVDGLDSADFVTQGEVVTSVGGGGWVANTGVAPSLISHLAGTTQVANGVVELELQGPMMLGGVEYGLQSVTYCIQSVTGGAYVTQARVYPGSTSIPFLATDATDRTTAGCYDLDVGASGETYSVTIEVTGSSLRVGGLEAHWLPEADLNSFGSASGGGPDPAAGQ